MCNVVIIVYRRCGSTGGIADTTLHLSTLVSKYILLRLSDALQITVQQKYIEYLKKIYCFFRKHAYLECVVFVGWNFL